MYNYMRKEELQFISDSILMNSFFNMDPDIIKQAGLFDSLGFGNFGTFIQDTIKQFISEHLNPDKPGGIIGGIITFLANGAIFKANPLVWVLMTAISNLLGINIDSIIGIIVDKVGSVLKSTGKIGIDKINSIGKSVASSFASSSSCDDMLCVLRDYSNNAKDINRKAYLISLTKVGTRKANIPWFGDKSESILKKIFGKDLFRKVPKGRLGYLLVGIITWIIKTSLLGAGLLAGVGVAGGLIHSLIGGKGKKEETKEEPKTETKVEEVDNKETRKKITDIKTKIHNKFLTPSGKGEKYFANDTDNLWIVPIVGDIESTVLRWAFYVYPSFDTMNGEDIILSLPSFQRVVSELEKAYNPRMSDELSMPSKFHSLKQVVDTFASDAAAEISREIRY